MKNKSIFKVMFDTVSKLPWLHKSRTPSKKQMKPGKDFNQPASNTSSDYLKGLSEEEFEKLVCVIFKQRGYSVSEKHEGAYDGVDLVLQMNHESTFVQFSHWKEEQVDVTAVGELYLAMTAGGAPHGIVIASGVFTPDALDFALGKTLLLINGVDLSQMIEALNTSSDDNLSSETQTENSEEESKQEMPELEPLCPICSSKMIKRTAKKGKNAGNTFWGCSKFPNCRGVVSS